MKKLVLSLIKLYQRSWFFRSSFLKALFMTDAACRFRPTCSQYTYQAVKSYGIMRGGLRGLRRILKCHPWNQGGYDPLN